MPLTARLLFKADGAAQVKRESDEVAASVSRAGKKVNEANKLISKGATVVAAAVLGLGAVSVKSALNLNASQTVLQNALRNTGAAGQRAFKGIEDQLTSLSTRGGGSIEEMNAGLGQFINQTHSVTEAEKANQAAVQLSIQQHISYQQAQGLMSSALAGRVKGIQRYIGIIQPVKTAEQQLTESHKWNTLAMEAQAKAMGKAGPAWLKQQAIIHGITPTMTAAAAATDKQRTAQTILTAVLHSTTGAHESMSQRVTDAKHAFTNMAATIGTMLLPIVKALTVEGTKMADWMQKNKTLVVVLAGVLGGLAITIKTVEFATKAWKAINTLTTVGLKILGKAGLMSGEESAAGADTASVAWKGFMASTIIGIVLVGIVMLIEHWKTVEQVGRAVAHALGAAFSAAWSVIKSAAMFVFDFYKAEFKILKTIILGVVHFIEGLATSIFNALTFPFRKAFGFIKAGFNAVKHFIHGIPLIGGLFHSGGPVHRASGGPIYRDMGGPSGTDTVPAWLTPGEFVMQRSAVASFGASNLAAINAGNHAGIGDHTIRVEQPWILKLDSRVIAQGVMQQVLRKAARGPGQVGGALATASAAVATGA